MAEIHKVICDKCGVDKNIVHYINLTHSYNLCPKHLKERINPDSKITDNFFNKEESK